MEMASRGSEEESSRESSQFANAAPSKHRRGNDDASLEKRSMSLLLLFRQLSNDRPPRRPQQSGPASSSRPHLTCVNFTNFAHRCLSEPRFSSNATERLTVFCTSSMSLLMICT